jgi:cell division protein FtsL
MMSSTGKVRLDPHAYIYQDPHMAHATTSLITLPNDSTRIRLHDHSISRASKYKGILKREKKNMSSHNLSIYKVVCSDRTRVNTAAVTRVITQLNDPVSDRHTHPSPDPSHVTRPVEN